MGETANGRDGDLAYFWPSLSGEAVARIAGLSQVQSACDSPGLVAVSAHRIFHESIRPETVQRDCDVAGCAVRYLFSKRDRFLVARGFYGANRPVGILPDD